MKFLAILLSVLFLFTSAFAAEKTAKKAPAKKAPAKAAVKAPVLPKLPVKNSFVKEAYTDPAVIQKINELQQQIDILKAQAVQPKPSRLENQLAVSFDSTTRFNDYTWANETVNKACNDNHFEERFGMNLTGHVSPSINYNLRVERLGYYNSTAGQWTQFNGVQGHGDSDINTYLAFIQAKDVFGWVTDLKVGRQPVGIGHNFLLNGVADGIVLGKKIPEWHNLYLSFGGFALDGIDADGNNNNDGIGLYYIDLKDAFAQDWIAEAYYMNSKNPNARVILPGTTRTQAQMFDGWADRYSWLGAGLTYNGFKDISLYGELVKSYWENDLNVNGEMQNGDPAQILGIDWKATPKFVATSKFINAGDHFFAPANNAGQNIFDTDTYLFGDDELWNAAGYRYDFSSWINKVTYDLTDKVALTGAYELINDRRDVQVADDRNILTGAISYKYNPHASVKLTARKVFTNSNEGAVPVSRVANGAMILGNAGGANLGAANEVNVDDVTLVRIQLDVNF